MLPDAHNTRLGSIDYFRGLAILMMVLVHYLSGIQWLPPALRVADDPGFTIVDLVAPFFIFAIGLTLPLSFRKRLARDGPGAAYGHLFMRNTVLVGLGLLVGGIEILLGLNASGINWGVLPAIGMAGLVALTVINLQPGWRFLIGLVILAAYQLVLDHYALQLVVTAPQGGIYGSLGWGAMLILATVLADIYHSSPNRRVKLALTGLALVLCGVLLSGLVPLSKHRISASYVLFSLGVSAVLFTLVDIITTSSRHPWYPLLWWGRNPLILYLSHFLLLGLVALPRIPGWYAQASWWLMSVQVCGLVVLLTGLAWWLARRKLYLAI